jgi:hypothetical protein
MNEQELTEDQKKLILEGFAKTPDLRELTKKVFNNPNIDGRSIEGRLVRSFLSKQNLNYKTSLVEKVDEIELTKEQKEFLMSDNIENGINALEASRLAFKDRSIQSLSIRHRVVTEFLKRNRPEIINEEDQITSDRWTPPKSISRVIKKINDWAGVNLDEITMSTKQKRLCEKLLIYLRSPRFINIINQYSTISDRELFESEYVRVVWDKPDLTVDEQNLYITVCANYVRQKHIQQRMDRLNGLLNDADNDRDITMRLTEIIKATSEELNQCEKRIESLTKDLNGSRQARLKEKGEQSGNIFALVEAFQDKEERDRMIMMAELQNKLIEQEADRLESMDEFKARILGISKRELL